jgi:hypothetical protein
MLNRFNSFLGSMVPSGNMGGLLSPQDARAAGQQARAMLASSLLQSAGPQRAPISFGQALGTAMPAAFEAYDRRAELGLRNDLTRRHIEELDRADRERARRERETQEISEIVGLLGTETDGSGPLVTPRVSNLLSVVARSDPRGAIGLAAQIPGLFGTRQPISDTGKKALELSAAIGRELTEPEKLALYGLDKLYDPADDELDNVISTTDLQRLRRPDGSPYPYGTTAREAKGARVVDPESLKRSQSLQAAVGVLTDLKRLQGQIDESGLIQGVGKNALARFANGVGNAIGSLAGTEAAQARTLFRDLSRGTVGPLIRSLGESGALAEGDVNRAIALLPSNDGLFPDSTDLANAKLGELEELLRRAAENLGVSESAAPSTGGSIRFLGFEGE